ncbi:MAG: hypothetical protein B7Y76_08410, partial [Sphingobacteriia bacterium 35-40-5]
MNKKLLHKTLRAYLLYSLLILVIAAPVFYYATQNIYLTDVDESLLLHKNEFVQYIAPSLSKADIIQWNTFNRNSKISAQSSIEKDTIYNTFYYDSLASELEPYREIKAALTIQGKLYTYTGRIDLVENEDVVKNILMLFIAIISILLIGLFFITKKMSLALWKPFY